MRTTLALALMGAALISVPATAQTAGSADTNQTNTAATPAPKGSASPLYRNETRSMACDEARRAQRL